MYDRDILDELADAKRRPVLTTVAARPGTLLEHRGSGFVGDVVRFTGDAVELRDRSGRTRLFALGPGAFLVEGRPVTVTRAATAAPRPAGAVTASGSRAAAAARARVARRSRIWVEGRHDAELVERVWGDDLRGEGIVVERLDGLDHLPGAVAAFGPGRGARLGVLADHLVEGSKEARLAASVRGPDVLVTGTPFVDVWQAVRPKAAGIERWPVIPPGTPWKDGVCAALGVRDPAAMWRRLLASVTTYADLEPELVGAVEQLIDFVTDDGAL